MHNMVFAQEGEKNAAETPATKSQEKPENTANDSSKSRNIPRSSMVINAPVDANQQNQQDLKHYLANENIEAMLAGPNDFLTIVTPNTSKNEKGVAILLADWQHTATDPKALNFLRKTLPEQGWTTIAIQPKNKPANFPSSSENKTQFDEENKTALMQYQQELAALMKVVMEKAQDYPGIILMISQGNNAAQLQTYLVDEKRAKGEIPNAFISLSAYMPTPLENQQLAQQMSGSGIATLDLFLQRDHPLAHSNAKLRKDLATKEMKVIYRQKQLANRYAGYYPEQDLLKQINGWLRSIGW